MTRFQRWLLYASTIAATLSGVTYFWLRRFVEPADSWAVVNHPLEPWALKVHILTAPLMLFAVGLITTQHIWRSVKSSLPTGRRSGIVGAAVFGPLVLSGYLIQTVTNELILEVLGWTHLVLGLVCAGAILIHRRVVRGGRRRPGRGSLPVIRSPATLERADTAERVAQDRVGVDHPGVPVGAASHHASEVGGSETEPMDRGEVSSISPAVDAGDASPSAAETHARRSRSHRPKTDLPEESSSAASS